MSKTKRIAPRRAVLWKGKLEFGEFTFECQIRNISLSGAKVNAGLPLPPGTKFKLHLDRIGEVTGTVAWADEDLLGIRFEADPKFIREALGESAERFGLVEDSNVDEAMAGSE
jgi:hypothetical protein